MGFVNPNNAPENLHAVILGINAHCAPNTEDYPQGSNCQAHCVPNQAQDETKRQVTYDLIPLYDSLPIPASLSKTDKQTPDKQTQDMQHGHPLFLGLRWVSVFSQTRRPNAVP